MELEELEGERLGAGEIDDPAPAGKKARLGIASIFASDAIMSRNERSFCNIANKRP